MNTKLTVQLARGENLVVRVKGFPDITVAANQGHVEVNAAQNNARLIVGQSHSATATSHSAPRPINANRNRNRNHSRSGVAHIGQRKATQKPTTQRIAA